MVCGGFGMTREAVGQGTIRGMPNPVHPPTLPAVWADAWERLATGAAGRDDPHHQGVLATIGPQGPQARTVVLRHVDPVGGVIGFHTDIRSPKWTELMADPRATWVSYGHGVQVRLQGRIQAHHDDAVAKQAWAATRDFGRRCYLATAAPGTPTADPTTGLPAEELATALGEAHFGVLRLHIERLDWLHLLALGHRRAGFKRVDGRWDGTWMIP